ncbi:MAG: sugar ABC transporter substrate-binding protein [Caldilineaceae bacterium]|nr:sugar ABC transporter substrate-binding protein [Caldilineaceae bacterium]
MLHKKFITLFTFVAIMAGLVLAACAPAQLPLPAAEDVATPITFLISGDPTDETTYQTLIDAFGAAHGDIAVQLINIPSGGDFRKRLAADFAAGTPPDLFLINYRYLGPFFARRAVEPLTDYLAQSAQITVDDYYPQVLRAFQWNGVQMCMPQNISSPVIYYNKALFDAAGVAYPQDDWTWADFVATAQATTTDADGDGATDIYGLGVDATIIRAAPFIWMNGGDIVDDPAAPTKLTLDAPASQAALAWFIALQTEHHVTPDAVAEEAESSLSRFINGRLAMFMDSRRAVPEFRLIERFDWDVAALPVGQQRASVLHADAFCMAMASEHKDAAWTFLEFANSADGQAILAQTGRTVPSLKALAESDVFLDAGAKPTNSRAFLDAIPGMRNLPLMNGWSDIEGIVNTELQNAYYGRATLGEAIQLATQRSAEFFAK